jgi:choline dehydrogenase-like flavoprotein
MEAGGKSAEPSLRYPSDRFSLAFTNPELDYGYATTPQRSLNGREIPFARGKGLGGSSKINFTAWTWGCKDDYDNWASIVGDESWNWKNVQRRLKKASNSLLRSAPRPILLKDEFFDCR